MSIAPLASTPAGSADLWSEQRLIAVEHLLVDTDRAGVVGTAAGLARLGIPVFPCVPGGKRPATSHGFLDATTDPDQITRWWKRWRQANLAVPTGRLSGLAVVDVDVRPGGDGHETLNKAAGRMDLSGWGWVVATPSGGHHVYYAAGPASGRSWASSGHVDFRGEGGYIIVPPAQVARSDGSVGTYRLVETQRQMQPIDGVWLHRLVDPVWAARQSVPSPAARRIVSADAQQVQAGRLARWVAGLPAGERNQGLFWAACRLSEQGCNLADAQQVLGPPAAHAGLDTREITATIASAWRGTHPAPTQPSSMSGLSAYRGPDRVVRL